MSPRKISIAGTVGIPASYGGFETLAENLVVYAQTAKDNVDVSVYCSGKPSENSTYRGASLRYVDMNANGVSSIAYDILSLFSALKRKDDVVLLLGVSGAIALPLIRLVSKTTIVTNIDGIEWKREKWGRLASAFLKFSENVAVRFSHVVIADNEGIAQHVCNSYGTDCKVIAYGGDHAYQVEASELPFNVPEQFVLGLCRIEPENNVSMILEGFEQINSHNLVFVGNWNASEYGRELKLQYQSVTNITLLDPIYDVGRLKAIRERATAYVHGHSAGGTNPSLVEMMHFGIPVYAFDCIYNRFTTEDKAIYFKSPEDIESSLHNTTDAKRMQVGIDMKKIAQRRYTWEVVAKEYFDIILAQ
jgi:glycosyltransferase involved in cell wall biosynthesis